MRGPARSVMLAGLSATALVAAGCSGDAGGPGATGTGAGQDVSGLMAIMKLVHTEQERDKFEVLLDVMGYHALGWDQGTFTGQEQAITRGWLNSFALTISGGSSEVQLNVIAKRVLGLPDVK